MSAKLNKAIKVLQASGHRLMGGNCGMVALALYKYADDPKLEIAIATDAATENALYEEPTIYHVFLLKGSKAWDGDGQVSTTHIADWIEEEYNDSDPEVYIFNHNDLAKVSRIVRNDTNWSIDWTEFYDLIKGASKSTS